MVYFVSSRRTYCGCILSGDSSTILPRDNSNIFSLDITIITSVDIYKTPSGD